MNVQISFSKRDDITIMELSGRFIGKEAEEVVKEANNYVGDQPDAKIIVDLTKLEYIGSQGASALVLLSQKYRIKAVTPPSFVRDALTLLNLQSLMELFDSLDKAIGSFKK